MAKSTATLLVVALAAGYARAQSGLAVAMYVPHDLQTLDGSGNGVWKGSFEAPLTTNLRGDKADWAAFCVEDTGATCFSEPVSEIASGVYTKSGELIEFEVTGIPVPQNSDPGVVCYVATVFEKGQICSKPVLDYTTIGPVSNGNFNWAALHSDANRAMADNPVLARIAEAAKETAQMVQSAFGNLQKDTATEIEGHVEAFNAEELQQLLADEVQAVAELFRPKPTPAVDAPVVEAPVVEAPVADEPEEVYGAAIVTPLDVEVTVPVVEAPVADEPEEVYGAAIVTPLDVEVTVPVVEPVVEVPVVEEPEEVYGAAIVTPLDVEVTVPVVEVPVVEAPVVEEPEEVYGAAIVTPLDVEVTVPVVEPVVEVPVVEEPEEVYGAAIVTPLDVEVTVPVVEVPVVEEPEEVYGAAIVTPLDEEVLVPVVEAPAPEAPAPEAPTVEILAVDEPVEIYGTAIVTPLPPVDL